MATFVSNLQFLKLEVFRWAAAAFDDVRNVMYYHRVLATDRRAMTSHSADALFEWDLWQ